MNITDFLAIGIVGAALSAAFQYFKTVSGWKSKLWIIGLSIVVGTLYYFVRQTVWWEAIVGVLVASSTVYTLFIK